VTFTETDRRCSFELDRERARPDGWTCPHEPHGDADRCVFHLDVDRRADLGVDDDDVRDRLLKAIGRPGRRSKQFLGATFERLDLSYRDVDAPDNYPIDLRYATVRGRFVATDAAISHPVILDGARLGGVSVTDSAFRRGLSIRRATVAGAVDLRTTFDGRVEFVGTTFEGPFRLDEMAFNRYARFDDCVFRDEVDLYVDFNEEPHFTGARFEAGADFFMDANADSYFDEATFEGPTNLYAEFDGDVYFDGATFADDLRVYGRFNVDAFFRGVTFGGAANLRWNDADLDAVRFCGVTDFTGATFRGEADFGNVEFIGGADFTGARFEAVASFSAASFSRPTSFVDVSFADVLSLTAAEFDRRLTLSPASVDGVVDLADATVSAGRILVSPTSTVAYDLTRATVGEVGFEWSEAPTDDDALLRRFVLSETNFDGFDFSRHRAQLARRNWVIHGGPGRDPTPERVETTYLKAKNGATLVGENRAASEFFLRELRARRRRHRAGVLGGRTVRSRLRAAGRYAANLAMDATCGYGEKPSRVVASSVCIIWGFAAAYHRFGVSTRYAGFLGHLVLSLEAFVALVLGSPDVSEPYVNLHTATEAFLGAYFIALFVFALTRSIHR
jgi:uncharacterized protein YjbI with pentapeptide repeats